ncbi:GAF domain-containing protein [Rubellimicrobium roseum]|uniref:histidine kinase n=2 Tax=Rubellimicrobium roseum TaxID=687525 RepID=A0A5C4N5Y9_9RHOB|nr:GAF domain-containing protein [Rubellimicrobium roseum]
MAGDDRLPDLSECAREPIQFLGHVQAFGCLLVISNDWVIQNASVNTAEILGLAASDLIGTRLVEHLPLRAMHDLRGKLQTLSNGDDSGRVFGVDLRGDGERFDVALHRAGLSYIIEFERKTSDRQRDDMALVQPLLARVRKGRTASEMCQAGARALTALTGFARVMVYRFEPDRNGVVIAESRAEGMDSYLGLHFPAGDIPPQARALYTKSLLRIIADADAPVSPIVPDRDPEGQPVDLSLAVTRAVSPIHLEYLRNMGVRASMSVSILRDGELWGLMACHHPEPHHIDYETRSAVELFTQLFSYELNLCEERVERERVGRAHDLHERLVMLFEAGLDFSTGLEQIANEIGDVIDFDGLALCSGGRYCAQGHAPTEAEFAQLERHLARAPAGRVFVTEHLEQACLGAVAPERQIGGLLALPLKQHPRRFLMLFRREVTRNVVWAGNPDKMVRDGGRIHPRKSFAAWAETVRGRSAPWTPAERRAAEVVRITLLELVLKLTSDQNVAGQKRSRKQEVLISELNHRLRNVFGLVSGIVAQADPNGEAGGRIRALARANDQLTRARQGRFSLADLIRDEVAAFAPNPQRVQIEGGDARLPAAVGDTLSLVVHELVTNSVKYGALGAPAGEVGIVFAPKAAGGVEWVWQERGGPPVVQPERVGFGSTLISRSIPHELGGEAEIDYHPNGLRARFCLPSQHAEHVPDRSSVPAGSGSKPKVVPRPSVRLSGTALVVEDNLIIAMNAADALRGLGAQEVLTAGSPAEALKIIDRHVISLAILDVDLGGQTSAPVAERLKEVGVPYLLATGYDAEQAAREASVPVAHVLSKPYSNDGIGDILSRMRDG